MNRDLFQLRAAHGVRSHAINQENPTGAPGAAASAASALGPGRKGAPARILRAGETAVLADIEGPGVIRHIWMTVPDRTAAGPFVLRDLVLRIYWDGEQAPSVESPLGDFFCNGFAERAQVISEPIAVVPVGGMNCYIPMPFRSRARIEVTSEHGGPVDALFYQIDYTTGDEVAADSPYFHAQWRRSNATTALGEDHVILDGVCGAGRYLGTYVGLAALSRYWWGEGEVKFFIDSDEALPSLCSTGLEDYAGGAWAFQDSQQTAPAPKALPFSAPYCGYPLYQHTDTTKASTFTTPMLPMHTMYRWHIPDPIFFEERIRVTVQQLGMWEHGLYERSDDVFSVAYWYQTEPHAAFPALPPVGQRAPR